MARRNYLCTVFRALVADSLPFVSYNIFNRWHVSHIKKFTCELTRYEKVKVLCPVDANCMCFTKISDSLRFGLESVIEREFVLLDLLLLLTYQHTENKAMPVCKSVIGGLEFIQCEFAEIMDDFA